MINPLDKQNQIIEILAKNEEAVQQLYRIYATKYPSYKDLWLELSGDELQHASLIRNLGLELKNEPQKRLFRQDRFTLEALQSSVDYVKGLIQQTKTEDYPLITALSLAMQLEQALIEKKFFEVFEGDDFEFKKTLNSLKADTQGHFERLKKAWEKERQIF